jgi:hypothetical protein
MHLKRACGHPENDYFYSGDKYTKRLDLGVTTPQRQRVAAVAKLILLLLTMSSGFGLKGNIGRCYPFFAEYKECLVGGKRARMCETKQKNIFVTGLCHVQQQGGNDIVSMLCTVLDSTFE